MPLVNSTKKRLREPGVEVLKEARVVDHQLGVLESLGPPATVGAKRSSVLSICSFIIGGEKNIQQSVFLQEPVLPRPPVQVTQSPKL